MSKNINESKITSTRVLVTPEIAEEYLTKVPEHQRNLIKATVLSYANEMKAGRWLENAETIKFDTDGKLMDGQHRLHAIIDSGKSQWMLIARGVPAKAFGTVDVGRKRTPGDIFSIAGWAQSTSAAAIARMICSCEYSHRHGFVSIRKLPPDQFLAYANKHRTEVEIGIEIMKQIRGLMTPPASIAGALAYLHRWAPEAARDFTIKIVEGADLARESPALVLRNKLCETEGAGEFISAKRIAEVFAMFGAHLKGSRLSKLVPITQDGNSWVTPLILIDADTAIDASGDRKGISAMQNQRARARTRKGKGKVKSKANAKAA